MSWGPFDLLRPLFDFLKCLVVFAVGALVAGLVEVFNLLIAGLMLLLGPLLAILPEVNLSEVRLPRFLAMANWVFPLDHFVIALGIVIVVLVAWHVISVGLRWLKVIE